MWKGDVIHPGPVYICEHCQALIRPDINVQSVHAHGNKIIHDCKDFYCNNRIVIKRWYNCPSCDKTVKLPPDEGAENLTEDR